MIDLLNDVFPKLPARLQLAMYRWAMRSGRFVLAWNLADYSDCERLPVDNMIRAAASAHKAFGNSAR